MHKGAGRLLIQHNSGQQGGGAHLWITLVQGKSVILYYETYQNMIREPWQQPEFNNTRNTSVPEEGREEHNTESQHTIVADSHSQAVLGLVVWDIKVLLCPVKLKYNNIR